jgi:hypothetical protein
VFYYIFSFCDLSFLNQKLLRLEFLTFLWNVLLLIIGCGSSIFPSSQYKSSGVSLGVAEGVNVSVGVSVGVSVTVSVAVGVGVTVSVGVGVGVLVSVGLGVGVSVGVEVGIKSGVD